MCALVLEPLVESDETGGERIVLRGDPPRMTVAEALALVRAERRSMTRPTYARIDDASRHADSVLGEPQVGATGAIDGRGTHDVGHR
jgi:hypothetical protein